MYCIFDHKMIIAHAGNYIGDCVKNFPAKDTMTSHFLFSLTLRLQKP